MAQHNVQPERAGRAARPFKARQDLRSAGIFGFGVIAFAFATIGVWGSLAPLTSAVVARGHFVASGQNKIVQHLEGGIIKDILVREGDHVEAGTPLIRLEKTAAQAQLRRHKLRRYMFMAMKVRLAAEHRAEDKPLAFPPELLEISNDAEVAETIVRQTTEFEARKHEMAAQIAVLENRRKGIGEEVVGLHAQKDATKTELSLIAEELKGTDELYKKGLTPIGKLLALQRAKAKLEGTIGSLTAEIGRAKERTGEIESQVQHLKSKRLEEISKDLRQVEADLADLEQQLTASRDIFERMEIRAPVKGVIVKLSKHTTGGVLSAGQDVIELLPISDELIIETFVQPNDIDSVKIGQSAWVRLTAFNQRIVPSVPAEVVYVSADRLEGKTPSEIYYIARLRVSQETAAQALQGHKPFPGMPAEVFITTGEHTLIEYLTRPFRDSLTRSLREG